MNYGQSSLDVALKLCKTLSTLRLQDATASCDKDKRMIDAAVSSHPGGFQAVTWCIGRGSLHCLYCRLQGATSSILDVRDLLVL